jgi:hypothetical protein
MDDPAEIVSTTGASRTPLRKRSTPTFGFLPRWLPFIANMPTTLSVASTKSEPSPGGCSTQDREPPKPWLPLRAENPAPSGCRVRICAGATFRLSGPPSTNADRAPPGGALHSGSPGYEAGRRRTIGGVWADAGSLGRMSVTAAQKADAEGSIRGSARIQHPEQRHRRYPQLSVAVPCSQPLSPGAATDADTDTGTDAVRMVTEKTQ